MIGKITKLATGHLYTNISDSEVNIDFLTALARESGISADLLADLNATVSANHFCEAIPPDHIKAIADKLCGLACRKCWNYVDQKLSVECILSDYNGAVLGRAVVEK